MSHPQKHPLRFSLLLMVLTSILSQCADHSDEDTAPQQDLIGEWKISSASCDSSIKREWTGVTVRFTQITLDSGALYVPGTAYDSIWSAAGHWKKDATTDAFFRDDGVKVDYYQESKSKLTLFAYLPWTSHSTCSDGICLSIITGMWRFELEK